jgi:hypothetical protein
MLKKNSNNPKGRRKKEVEWKIEYEKQNDRPKSISIVSINYLNTSMKRLSLMKYIIDIDLLYQREA